MTLKKHNTRQRLLHLLSDGKFHSGEDLGNQLGMTRSAIWKAVKQLENLDIEINSISGKGYRIPNGMSLLDKTKIESFVMQKNTSLINEIFVLEEIDSTNQFLFSKIDTEILKPMACFSERQTQGRGRRGRAWLSPFASNIYHSLLWYFEKDPSELMGLSLAVAVMTTRALKQYGIEMGLELKWPNDIFWESQKLAGILIEMVSQPQDICAVVIGIGINTRLSQQHIVELDRPVTSIEKITQHPADRNQLAGLLLNSLIEGFQQFQKNGLSAFLDEWRALDKFRGKMVTLSCAAQSVTGIMEDVSDNGALLLRNTDGKIKPYLSGEMSLSGA